MQSRYQSETWGEPTCTGQIRLAGRGPLFYSIFSGGKLSHQREQRNPKCLFGTLGSAGGAPGLLTPGDCITCGPSQCPPVQGGTPPPTTQGAIMSFGKNAVLGNDNDCFPGLPVFRADPGLGTGGLPELLEAQVGPGDPGVLERPGNTSKTYISHDSP